MTAPDPIEALNREAARRRVVTETGRPLEFVGADDAPARRAYEAHIAATGRVPTRFNAHDLFNALVWLAMPRTKARLNALQASVIENHGVAGRRGTLRDAATVFDENGALLVTEDVDLPKRLRARHWREVFVGRRGDWSEVSLLCFGHALMQKLMAPYKGITAHVLVITLPRQTTLSELDLATSTRIEEDFSISALLPLPVLGVPGWCAENADPVFYDDPSVFRPARTAVGGPCRKGSCTMQRRFA